MKPSILSKLKSLAKRHEEVEHLLVDPGVVCNLDRFKALSKELSQLGELTRCFRAYQQVQDDLSYAEEIEKENSEADIRVMAQEEIREAKEKIKTLSEEIQILLLPKDLDDARNCFLEIRAGAGGDEAGIFAGDLFRMYSRYAERRYWHVEVVSSSESDRGGYKELILKISGDAVYGALKFESGGHRVQRVPVTESQGRLHTSTCTVAAMPEVPEAEPEIKTSDLKINTFRSSGAGGQHVNTTDSAIRITHLPTGTVVECQDERSQHKNRAKAMSVLAARIARAEEAKRSAEVSDTRRNLLGSGDRSDRIRTYNYPQGRISDHRIHLTLYRLSEVMEGDLSVLIEPLLLEHQADQLAALSDTS